MHRDFAATLLWWNRDIADLIDSSGKQVVVYKYDSWGNTVSITGSLASTVGQKNPFRYRGYYLDAETGMYYLRSRYYDPGIRRFISPDSMDILTAAEMTLSDKNLYAYCDNNPIMRADNGGEAWITIGIMAVGGTIGAALGALSSAVSQYVFTGSINWKSVGVAAVGGLVSGAVAASPLGLGKQVGAGALIGSASNVITSVWSRDKLRMSVK